MHRAVPRTTLRLTLATALLLSTALPAAAQIQLAPPVPGPGAQGYPPPAPAYPPPGYAAPAYPAPAYPAPAYPGPAYRPPAYPPPGYPTPAYPTSPYPAPGYPAPAYPAPGPQGPPAQGGPPRVIEPQGAPAPATPAPAPSPPAPSAPTAPGAPAPSASGPAAPNSPQAPPAESWIPKGTAELIALNNVTARTTTLTAPVGQTVTFGSLTIAVRSCLVRPPDLSPDATAWVQIADFRQGAPGFTGWMLKEEPYLNAFQSAVYDIRLAGCH